MIQCPNCREMIPEDSAFCDQCGKELMWCPVCKRPKRGTECPVCGNDLVPGRKYLAGCGNTSPSANNKADAPGDVSPHPSVMPGPSVIPSEASVSPKDVPSKLVGAGLSLTLQPGTFGRRGGIWPELGICQYISGNHGTVNKAGNDWTITDNGSTNGTYVNGIRLAPGAATPLKVGDKVKFSSLELTVE